LEKLAAVFTKEKEKEKEKDGDFSDNLTKFLKIFFSSIFKVNANRFSYYNMFSI